MSAISLMQWIVGQPLNKNRGVWALAKFVRWQIGSRLLGMSVVYDWVGGSQFLVRTGETGLTGNVYAGLHEFPDMGFLLHFLRSDELFVDVGANVGSYTILACAAVGAHGVAIEPIPSTFLRLEQNVRLNRIENRVRCLNIGVGDAPRTLKFTSGLDTVNHAVATSDNAENTIDVELSCLDTILLDAQPVLVKIDVEGFETPVLQGASNILKSPSLKAIIMELNGSGLRYGYDEGDILQLMSDHGFEPCSYDPLSRTLMAIGKKNVHSGNTIFVRDKDFVLDRIRSAPTYAVHGRTL